MTTTVAPRSAAIPRSHAFARSAVAVLALATAIALAGQARIPLPWTPVPATLQTFAVLLGAGLVGPVRGASAAALVVTGGAAGLPVFQGGAAGLAYAFGATGGYLLALLPAAALAGAFAGRSPRAFAAALAASTVLILGMGSLWLGLVTGLPASAVLAQGILPFLPLDIVKASAAYLGTRSLRPAVRRAID